MYKISVTYSRGKDFERDDVIKVCYTGKDGNEVSVCGPDLETYLFPLDVDLSVYAEDGVSTAICKDLRSISIFRQDDL